MMPITRRSTLFGAAASGIGIGLGFPQGICGAAAATTLNLLSWGWGYDTAIKSIIMPKFKDLAAELEIGTNASNYSKLVAQRSNPVLSGGTFNGVFSYRGSDDKMWVPITKSDIPNSST